MRGFGYILPTRIFIECVWPIITIRSLYTIDQRRRAHVNPRCDETYFSRASPISDSFSDGSGFRHSVSRSYNADPLILIQQSWWNPKYGLLLTRRTSIVRSSSIFTALPNMKMYCMRFENSHIFRSRSSMLVSAVGSEVSISA